MTYSKPSLFLVLDNGRTLDVFKLLLGNTVISNYFLHCFYSWLTTFVIIIIRVHRIYMLTNPFPPQFFLYLIPICGSISFFLKHTQKLW